MDWYIRISSFLQLTKFQKNDSNNKTARMVGYDLFVQHTPFHVVIHYVNKYVHEVCLIYYSRSDLPNSSIG